MIGYSYLICLGLSIQFTTETGSIVTGIFRPIFENNCALQAPVALTKFFASNLPLLVVQEMILFPSVIMASTSVFSNNSTLFSSITSYKTERSMLGSN